MTDAAAPTPVAPAPIVVALERPFKRGEVEHATIALRRFAPPVLRGLQIMALLRGDYLAIETILPRIADPALTKQEIAALDPADLAQIQSEIYQLLTETDDGDAAKIVVVRPDAGRLRGLSIALLRELDYGSLELLLPRITEPALDKAAIVALPLPRFVDLALEVLDFLLPSAAKLDFPRG